MAKNDTNTLGTDNTETSPVVDAGTDTTVTDGAIADPAAGTTPTTDATAPVDATTPETQQEPVDVPEQPAPTETIVTPDPVVAPTTEAPMETPTVPEVPETQNPDQTATPTPEQPVQTSTVDSVMVQNDVASLLGKTDISFKEKLETIAKKAVGSLSVLASKLINYEKEMSKYIHDEKIGASNHYDLYHSILNAINTVDYADFKVKFDIINTAFLAHKDSSFKETMLHRFDMHWKWGKKELTTFQHLALLINYMCDLSKRADNLKIIDVNKALSQQDTVLTETAIANIKKYYQI